MHRSLLAIATWILLILASRPLLAGDISVVQLEDPSPTRLHYPLLLADGRGFRIRCASQTDEEAIIHGLGFLTSPAEILTPADAKIVAAKPDENPPLCPNSESFAIKTFSADDPSGPIYYLQFPAELGSAAASDRLYVPGCAGLVSALALDLTKALKADPTPFFAGKIHKISCLNGVPLAVAPTSFTDWCMKGDRSAAETATVMAMLDATPGGISALGNAAACKAANDFLQSIPTLNLNERAVQSLAPISVLNKLTSLTLSKNAISDLEPITKLTALTFLDISNNKVAKLAALTPLNALLRLNASNNLVTDIRPLSSLTLLTQLKLDGNKITDLAPLQFMQVMTELSLAANDLTGDKLEPLTALGTLKKLNLANNKIASLEHLVNFPSDLEMDLTGNPIVTSGGNTFEDLCILHRDKPTPFGQTVRAVIEAVGGGSCSFANNAVMARTTLDLSSKSLSDLRPLAVLTQLTDLKLGANAITDISPLSALAKLRHVDLKANLITDIRPLASLANLNDFDASENPVALPEFLSACLMRLHQNVLNHDQQIEVDALLSVSSQTRCQAVVDDLQQMESANFFGRGLTTLNYFTVLKNIRDIDLTSNGLNDVVALQTLTSLRRIVARENNITSVNSFRPMHALEEIDISKNPISSLVGLAELGRLKSLRFSETGVTSVLPLEDMPLLQTAEMRNLNLTYANLREYCLVNRFDPIALGNDRSFMAAIETRLEVAHVPRNDCVAVENWATSQTSLVLNKQFILSVRPIAFFPNLQELQLYNNLISDAGPIAGLQKITKLNLSTNRLESLPQFSSSNMRELYLSDNTLAAIGSLANLRSMTSLSVRGNRIRSAMVVENMPGLTSFDVRDNQISQIITIAPPAIKTIPDQVLPVTYLGGNPICGMASFNQQVAQACQRIPLNIKIIDVINSGVFTNFNACTEPNCFNTTIIKPGRFIINQ